MKGFKREPLKKEKNTHMAQNGKKEKRIAVVLWGRQEGTILCSFYQTHSLMKRYTVTKDLFIFGV